MEKRVVLELSSSTNFVYSLRREQNLLSPFLRSMSVYITVYICRRAHIPDR